MQAQLKFHRNYLARSIDLINLESLGTPITIIGCGSVGSAVAVQLSKMGFGNMTVWDFDTVEDVNIGCQRHGILDIGKNKAVATEHAVKHASGFTIKGIYVPYKGESLSGIVVSAVDMMDVRESIFKNSIPGTLIIDPRMAATQFDLLTCIKGQDDELYAPTLFKDENAVHTPCTMKSTMFCADILAGMVSYQVFKFSTKKPIDKRLIWIGENNSLINVYAPA